MIARRCYLNRPCYLNEGATTVTNVVQNKQLAANPKVFRVQNIHTQNLTIREVTLLVAIQNILGSNQLGEVFSLLGRTHIRSNDCPLTEARFDLAECFRLLNHEALVQSCYENVAVRVYNGHCGVVLCVDEPSYHLHAQSLSSVAYAVLTGIREVRNSQVDLCKRIDTTECISSQEHRHQLVAVLNLCVQVDTLNTTNAR